MHNGFIIPRIRRDLVGQKLQIVGQSWSSPTIVFGPGLEKPKNSERIAKLVEEIGSTLGVRVLLCFSPNYPLCNLKRAAVGKYSPQLAPCSEVIAVETSFPSHRAHVIFV